MLKKILWTIAILTVIAFCGSVLYNYLVTTMSFSTMEKGIGGPGITINQPFVGLDPLSCNILAVGGFLFLSCCGIAKIFAAWRIPPR